MPRVSLLRIGTVVEAPDAHGSLCRDVILLCLTRDSPQDAAHGVGKRVVRAHHRDVAYLDIHFTRWIRRAHPVGQVGVYRDKSELRISEGWWVYVNDFVDFDGKFGGGGGVVSNFSYLCSAKQSRDEVTTQTTTIYIITCEH